MNEKTANRLIFTASLGVAFCVGMLVGIFYQRGDLKVDLDFNNDGKVDIKDIDIAPLFKKLQPPV